MGEIVELYRRVIGKTSSPQTLFFIGMRASPHPNACKCVFQREHLHFMEFFLIDMYNIKRYCRYYKSITNTWCQHTVS